MRPQRNSSRDHGTTARYTSGCSCIECCDAWAAYRRSIKKHGPRMVDSAEVRTLLERYTRDGASFQAIAEATGCNRMHLVSIYKGTIKRCKPETLEAVQSYRHPPSGSRTLVPAHRTREIARRLNRTMSYRQIEAAAGHPIPRSNTKRVQYRVQEAYERLGFELGVARRPIDHERIARLLEEDAHPSTIAEVVGISERQAWRIVGAAS